MQSIQTSATTTTKMKSRYNSSYIPDVENNQLYAVVSTASKETQQGISKLFGSKVKMTVKR